MCKRTRQENLLTKYQVKLGHDVTLITTCNMNSADSTIVSCEPEDYISPDGFRVIRLNHKYILNKRELRELEKQMEFYCHECCGCMGCVEQECKCCECECKAHCECGCECECHEEAECTCKREEECGCCGKPLEECECNCSCHKH